MEQRFIQIQGVRLAYLEKNAGQTKTIFLIHHNCGSAQAWRKQLNSSLLTNYRLIAFDLPGHGQTEVVEKDLDYFNFLVLTDIMAQAISQLTTHVSYIIAGLSLGTNVIAEMLNEGLKPAGMVMAGPSLVGKTSFTINHMMKPGSEGGVLYTDEAAPALVERYARQTSVSTDPEDQEMIIQDYNAVRKTFRPKIGESIATGSYNDEIELLKNQNSPLLIVFGEKDQLVNIDYLDTAPLPLWQNIIHKIPGAGHLVNLDQPETFNRMLAAFAGEVLS